MGMGSSEKNQRQILSEKAQRARGGGDYSQFLQQELPGHDPQKL